MSTSHRHGRGRLGCHRALGLLAVPILVAQCAPTQCAPAPAPAPTTTVAAPTSTIVAPAPAPYTFLASNGAGLYTRWSSCPGEDAAITWQLDTTVAPSQGFRDAVAAALATLTAATGHTFVQAAEIASPVLQPGVEAVIGLRAFEGNTLGQGGGRFTSSYEMVEGVAYVDDRFLDPAQATLLRTTLLHELGHLIGLGHTDDPVQLMHPVLRQAWQDYQPGDRQGLFLVGTSQPCLASLLAAGDEPTREVILD